MQIQSLLPMLANLLTSKHITYQNKIRVCELVTIFEDAFDQLDIVQGSLCPNTFIKNHGQYQYDDMNLINFNSCPPMSEASHSDRFTLNPSVITMYLNTYDPVFQEIFFDVCLINLECMKAMQFVLKLDISSIC